MSQIIKKTSSCARNFLPYGRQSIEADDIAAVAAVLESDYLTTGPVVDQFEKALCDYTGAAAAVVVGNGTHALHLACLAAGVGAGDYVVVPSVTFLATANAVRYCGADVIFCDVDPQTGLMGADDLQKALDGNADKSIKAVLPVHLGGQSVDLAGLQNIADQNNLTVIADACHALGGSYQGNQTGSCAYEDMATFSFHPVKSITTGEGGAVLTNNQEWAEQMRGLRSHGMVRQPGKGAWMYEMHNLGFNYRLSDFQSAMGVSQLQKLDGFVAARSTLAARYDVLLESLAPLIRPPAQRGEGQNAWHLYAPRFDFAAIGKTRAEVMDALKAQGIGSQVHYIPVHTQPYYEGLYGAQDLPGAGEYYAGTLSLPLFPAMCDADVGRVVDALKTIIGG